MSAQLRKTVPVETVPTTIPATIATEDHFPTASPVGRMQRELHQRLVAGERVGAPEQYSLPARFMLLVGGGTCSWLAIYGIARLLMHDFG